MLKQKALMETTLVKCCHLVNGNTMNFWDLRPQTILRP